MSGNTPDKKDRTRWECGTLTIDMNRDELTAHLNALSQKRGGGRGRPKNPQPQPMPDIRQPCEDARHILQDGITTGAVK
ncbi:hypothetical protein LJC45_02715 [Alistipes sp. OttesenSCG-928-B03]|nr:hypothetical protein [Alistipes sp. OttesenSCG-928-B03]